MKLPFLLVTLLTFVTVMPLHATSDLDKVLHDLRAEAPKEPAPELTIPFLDASHNKVTLSDFAGDVVLVNFWATWCAPCVKEMPALDRLQNTYGSQGLKVVSVSQDFGGLPVVKRFYEQKKIKHMDIYLDDRNRLFDALGEQSLPYTVIVDRQGNIAFRHSGYIDWTKASEQLRLQQILVRK